MVYEKVQNIDQWLFVLILFLLRVVQICDILWMTEWIIDLLGPCICFSSQTNILSININLLTTLIFCGVKIIVCHKILNFNKIVLKKKTQTLRKVSHWQFECIGDRIKCHILVFDSPKKKKKSWKDTKSFIILLDKTFYIHNIDFNIHHIYVKHFDRSKCVTMIT